MFAVGGLGGYELGPREETWFRAGYGDMQLDPVALAYYRYARAVADIGAYGQVLFLMPDAGQATKLNAAAGLRNLFLPGHIVARAYESTC